MLKYVLVLTLLVGCGADDNVDDYLDITEPACWTNDGDSVIYKFIPEGAEVDNKFYEMCEVLGQ
jgi:hypothetical protein